MRVLLLADGPGQAASYANVVRHFAHEAAERGVTIAFGSMQHTGLPLKYVHRGRTYPHYGCFPPHRITDAVRDFDPDLVVHVRDPIVHIPRLFPQGGYSVAGQMANGAPAWTWVPVQHEVVPWDYVDALHREYRVVMPFTEAGGRVLGDAGLVRDRIEPLHLGVSDAYSDPDGPQATDYGRPGIRIAMSVGLGHQDRKAFPMLARAFALARSRDPSLDLDWYLHTTPIGAFDLVEHARMFGVDGKWMFPRGYDPGIGFAEEELARRYRRAFAYFSTGTGEGWDMPLSEACALGRAVVFPADANRLEVTADYGGPKFPVATFPFPRSTNWERMMDVEHLAERILGLAGVEPDPAAGREYYARHSWATVAERFLEIAKRRGIA